MALGDDGQVAYWWVNQKQTFAQESAGGYLWSPKRNRNGAYNEFYENMTRVRPGDLIFSYRDTRVAALSVAVSTAYEAPKPSEFGIAGENWDNAGWRVDAHYALIPAEHQVRPKEHIALLAPLLPEKYSPLTADGSGLQAVYLAAVSTAMAEALLGLIPGGKGRASALMGMSIESLREEAESRLAQVIEDSQGLAPSEKEALVKARRGQGRYRRDVLEVEPICRVTGLSNPAFLRASHIKPWARCQTHAERLDKNNGLMLTPNADHLFDAGYITFSDEGDLLLSALLRSQEVYALGLGWALPPSPLRPEQRPYMAYHRREIFLAPAREDDLNPDPHEDYELSHSPHDEDPERWDMYPDEAKRQMWADARADQDVAERMAEDAAEAARAAGRPIVPHG